MGKVNEKEMEVEIEMEIKVSNLMPIVSMGFCFCRTFDYSDLDYLKKCPETLSPKDRLFSFEPKNGKGCSKH